MILPVSLTFAAACGLLGLWLAYRIVRIRYVGKVILGDGANPLLLGRMRAQANFVEYTPFVLILFVLIELAGASPLWLRAIALAYILARVLHAFGMDKTTMPNALRAIGALATWAILLVLAVWAIWLATRGAAGPVVHYL